MRAFTVAVTGLALAVAACGSYGTSTVGVPNQAQAKVASVVIALPSASLVAGQSQRANVTLKDANGDRLTGRAIVWYTSATSVASVNDSGDVLGVSPGAATVSAVSEGVAGQAGLTVVPPAPASVARVLVAVNPSAIVVGQTARATASFLDSAGNTLSDRVVTWQSGSPSVATVASNGDVSALSPGSAIITATSEGKTASATLSVSAPAPVPVASVSVSPSSSNLQIGGKVQLSATTRDANNNVLTGRAISWSSSNAAVATVSASGLVTAVSAGNASITASSEGQTAAAAITVNAPPPVAVASVSVSPSSSNLQIGGTVQLSATTRDANNNVLTGRVVTWSSSNTGVSTVSASGLVTAVAAGNATVTALSETKSGTAAVAVTAPAPVPVASVSVSPGTPSVEVGDSVQFSAVTRDGSNNVLTGRVISWSSSNTAVATVSASGLARTLAAGVAQISATSETKIGAATLTVTSPPPPGSGPVWRGNEPAGMTSINERSFSALNEDPSWENLSNPGATIVADATAPHSPSGTVHINYPAGYAGGDSPESTEISVGSYRVFYFCYWIKHSLNWQGHNTGISKHGYVWMGNSPLFVYEADGAGSAPLVTRMALQLVVAQPNSDGWYPQNLLPNATFTRGQWDYVEILLTGNTAGSADGSMDVYLNGAHVSHWTGIQYSSSTTAWNLFRIYPVWGGIGDVVTADQYLAWDHVYMSGKN